MKCVGCTVHFGSSTLRGELRVLRWECLNSQQQVELSSLNSQQQLNYLV